MTTEQSTRWTPRDLPAATASLGRWSWVITRPAELTSARNALRATLRAVQFPDGANEDVVDQLLLVFEELASNGLRHSGAPVEVRVSSCPEGWLVDVSDQRAEQPPVPATDRDPALGGLGLHLIARLSAAVGWAVIGTRKHVWAVVLPVNYATT